MCSIEPHVFGELVSLVLCANDIWYSVQCVVCVYVFNLKKKSTFYFAKYEGFDECIYGTFGVQYLHQD